jgi:hypothetical protein
MFVAAAGTPVADLHLSADGLSVHWLRAEKH